jgi:putative ABC transport system substrate-binding protein
MFLFIVTSIYERKGLEMKHTVYRKTALVLMSLLLLIPAFNVSGQGVAESDDEIRIGISKIIAHPALDAIEQGIMDGLAELGMENVRYDLQNANGDIPTASSIAQKFKADHVDIAVGIATPTAQALANSLQDIPVVFAAATEPIEAGLVETYEHGIDNVTGISDLTPVREQILLLQRVAGIKKLGHVYTSGEANAVLLAQMAEEVCDELGIEFIAAAVTNSSEVKQAAQSIAGKVDGFYVSNDNTVVSALPALADTAMYAGVPIMSADTTSAEGTDVLLAWGFDYYKLGKATASMIKQILDGTSPSDIPVGFMTDPKDIQLRINLDAAERLGIEIPQDILDQASIIVSSQQ